MAKQIFSNNASSLLAASITDTDLTIQVAVGFGALYPDPGEEEYFLVSLEDDTGDIEIVKVTSRSSDLLQVPVTGRGQEGTSAQSWTSGLARVELRNTRGTLETFIQRGGDAMEGDLDMDNHELIDVIISGAATRMEAGEIVDVPLRGVSGDVSNEIVVPTDGSPATSGGAVILTSANTEAIVAAAFVVGQIIMWYGLIADIPAGWALCNGENSTPDLRDKFIVGAGNTYAVSSTGGAATVSAGVTGSTALTLAQTPAHAHAPLMALSVSGGADSGILGTVESDGHIYNADPQPTDDVTLSEAMGGGDGHTHTTPALSILPPYFGLLFIMYVGI